MIAKFEKTSLSNQTIPQGHMFSLGSKIYLPTSSEKETHDAHYTIESFG